MYMDRKSNVSPILTANAQAGLKDWIDEVYVG